MQTITIHAVESVKAQTRQPRSQFRVTLFRGLTSASIVAGLVAIVVPVPAIAANDYERCTTELLNAKITTEEAASACSRAFLPKDLSACVSQLSRNSFAATDALTACRQVRRPTELATCVVDIRRQITDSTATDVLDSCRRSLLPTRYASCVIGLNQAAKVPSAKALDSCIDASYFPREVDPTFLPFTPSGGVSTTPLQTGGTMSPMTAPTSTTPAAP